MRTVSADDVDRLLAFPELVEALRATFAGNASAPLRHHHPIGAGEGSVTHLLMPAWTGNTPGPGEFLGTKIVSVFPGNRLRSLPAVHGSYLLQSGETGVPLAVIDGTRLTLWRTAAASALAAGYLARGEAKRLVMIGSGALAPFLVRAHAAVRPIAEVTVWNHRLAGAEALVETLARDGISARVAMDLEAAIAEADIVSCATLSTEPIVRGAWLRPGQHLDLVGAFAMGMREADAEALRRARIYVDTAAALEEGGEVALAIREGDFRPSDIAATLHELCAGRAKGRTGDEAITLFKSVGASIEDLAAAILIWRKLDGASA